MSKNEVARQHIKDSPRHPIDLINPSEKCKNEKLRTVTFGFPATLSPLIPFDVRSLLSCYLTWYWLTAGIVAAALLRSVHLLLKSNAFQMR